MASIRIGLASAVLALAASAAGASPCTPSATTLCVSDGRFAVSVAWKDFQNHTGDGQAVSLTADTGYFWFFSSSNVELIVKVLDARAINQKFWVFFGALSNVEYTLTVTDSVTGAVKRYQNPSGQFASVGDTTAFDGAVTAGQASRESVVVAGTASKLSSIAEIQRFIDRAGEARSPGIAAKASAPCPESSTSLFLSGCRFRVDVQWINSSGGGGSGQAVPLTSDTGYFWFFSDTNVELMVKVLDARVANGKFWVFFGALSNVEYTINVVDTLSGALRTYHNPPSTFASVGDTAAFRGGYGISVQTDDALAANGTISAQDGGSLSVTAADGTVFTLDVPANAVFEDQDITMTPVRSVGSLPFAGGLEAGVDLQPSGLVIPPGATLSIHTPTAISRSEETPVAWNGSGEDFFLFPPTPAGGDLELFIQHFGGYGVARGTDEERAAELAREPASDEDLISHQTSPFLRQGRAEVPGAVIWAPQAVTDWRSGLKVAYDLSYGHLRDRMVATNGEPHEVLVLVLQMLHWKADVAHTFGSVDAAFPGRDAELHSLLERIIKLALHAIHLLCTIDPIAITTAFPLINTAEQEGLNVEPDLSETLQCLTFKFRLTSTIKDTSRGAGRSGGAINVTNTADAEVTLETKREGSGFIRTEGEGTIDFTDISVSGLSADCSYTHSSGRTPITARMVWWNLYTTNRETSLVLLYDFGFPASTLLVTCEHFLPEDWSDLWWPEYDTFHHAQGQGNGTYEIYEPGWTLTGGRDPWAKKEINAPHDAFVSEKTTLTLTHTPR